MSSTGRRLGFVVGVASLLAGTLALGTPTGAASDSPHADTPLRTMAFNIFLGGTYAGGELNREHLVEFVRDEDPDVVFMVETYGSGDEIEAGLNAGVRPDRRYRGVQITQEPGQEEDKDNLWLFTRYPVVEVYPRITEAPATSFNFGGARIALPSGREVNLFTVWLDAGERAWFPTDATALDHAYGDEPSYTEEEIAASDYALRYDKARAILDRVLPRLVPDETVPTIVGGDLNTLSAYDWSARFDRAYGHEGMVIPWPVTTAFAQAGFTDTYREIYPDAGRYPGRTWSPFWGFGYAPARIDYIWTRGDGIGVAGSHTHTERQRRHQAHDIDTEYPFYSDHGALVTDLVIDGGGGAPFGHPRRERDRPDRPDTSPVGVRIDQAELGVSATSDQPGFEAHLVLDDDPDTFWNSAFAPHQPLPQSLTVDLGRDRHVTGLSYVGHLIGRVYEEPGFVAGIDRYTVSVSADGQTFVPAGEGQLARNRRPQWIPVRTLEGAPVRYVRLTAVEGFDAYAGVAELNVYERGR
jgi:hypothetical protein